MGKKVKKLLFKIHSETKKLMANSISSFTDEQLKNYETEYDDIITLSKEENKEENNNINLSYYKGKAKA